MATQFATPQVQPRSRSAVPTTVEQILSCKHDQFQIFDIPVQTVWLVGVIRNIKITSCEVSCEIQDHTGRIKGVIRLETEAEVAGKLSGITENNYVKFFGTVRRVGGERVVMVLKMFPVDDCNVITNHLLQFICFRLQAQAERNQQLASANSTGAALADSLTASEDETPSTSNAPHFTDFQKLVFDIVKSEFCDDGITRRNVLKQFPSYQGHDVNRALDYLVNEGMIYYSIDQEHLKAAVHY